MKRNLCKTCARIARETVDRKERRTRAASRGICDWCGTAIHGRFLLLIDSSGCGFYLEVPKIAREVKEVKVITL